MLLELLSVSQGTSIASNGRLYGRIKLSRYVQRVIFITNFQLLRILDCEQDRPTFHDHVFKNIRDVCTCGLGAASGIPG